MNTWQKIKDWIQEKTGILINKDMGDIKLNLNNKEDSINLKSSQSPQTKSDKIFRDEQNSNRIQNKTGDLSINPEETK